MFTEGNEALDCFTSFLVWHLKVIFENNVTDTRNVFQICIFDFFCIFFIMQQVVLISHDYASLRGHN